MQVEITLPEEFPAVLQPLLQAKMPQRFLEDFRYDGKRIPDDVVFRIFVAEGAFGLPPTAALRRVLVIQWKRSTSLGSGMEFDISIDREVLALAFQKGLKTVATECVGACGVSVAKKYIQKISPVEALPVAEALKLAKDDWYALPAWLREYYEAKDERCVVFELDGIFIREHGAREFKAKIGEWLLYRKMCGGEHEIISVRDAVFRASYVEMTTEGSCVGM